MVDPVQDYGLCQERVFLSNFLKYDPDSKNTFLQNTFLRVKKIKNISNPILICNEEHRFVVAEQMRQIEVKPQLIILEPFEEIQLQQ